MAYSFLSLSLIATIKKARPDLLSEVEAQGEGIPETVPPTFLADLWKSKQKAKEYPSIDDIGVPINARFFARVERDPAGW